MLHGLTEHPRRANEIYCADGEVLLMRVRLFLWQQAFSVGQNFADQLGVLSILGLFQGIAGFDQLANDRHGNQFLSLCLQRFETFLQFSQFCRTRAEFAEIDSFIGDRRIYSRVTCQHRQGFRSRFEIAIRNQFKGENTFFVAADTNSTTVEMYVELLFANEVAELVVAGTIEISEEKPFIQLFLAVKP